MASYSPVFSAQFIVYTESTPNSTFDVPVGFTAVVRQITVGVEAGGTLFGFFFANVPGAPGVQFAVLELTGLVQADQWAGRIVVPGGGAIAVEQATLGVGASAYVGGYLLRDVAA